MNSNVKIILWILAGFALIATIWFLTPGPSSSASDKTAPALDMVDGVQTINIRVKGGYSPNNIRAQAGVPTTLQLNTSGTYDCSAAVVIQQLGFEAMLKPTGTEKITLTPEQAQGTLKGQCAMGMYRFEVKFE